jgi:hypothetical protein
MKGGLLLLGTSEGTILNVHQLDGFGILICHVGEGFFTETGRSKTCCPWKSY